MGSRKGCGGGYRPNSGRLPGSQTPEEKKLNVERMNAAKALKRAEREALKAAERGEEAVKKVAAKPYMNILPENATIIGPEGGLQPLPEVLGPKTSKPPKLAPRMLKTPNVKRNNRKMSKLDKNNALVAEAMAPFAHLFDERVLAMDPLSQIEFGRFYHTQKFLETDDPKHLKSAMDAAVQSLPYLRPKLANIQNQVEVKHSVNDLDLKQINAILAMVEGENAENALVIDATDLARIKGPDE